MNYLLIENFKNICSALEKLRNEQNEANYKFEQRRKSLVFQGKKYRDAIVKHETEINSILELCRSGK